jgi:ketosteroid isomerase-like protein
MDICQRNKESVRRFIELVWNRGAFDSLGELLADDYVGYTPLSSAPVLGRTGVQERVGQCRLAIPDLYVKIDSLIGEADQVALSWRAAGSLARAPSADRLHYAGISVVRFLAGRQVEARTVWQQPVGCRGRHP